MTVKSPTAPSGARGAKTSSVNSQMKMPQMKVLENRGGFAMDTFMAYFIARQPEHKRNLLLLGIILGLTLIVSGWQRWQLARSLAWALSSQPWMFSPAGQASLHGGIRSW
mgnify:CR=1 FL=1